MIKRSTIILLFVLALAVGAYFIVKYRPVQSSESTPTALGSNFLVTEADGALQSLRISDDQSNVVQIQRDPSDVWVVTAPKTGEADQSLAGAAETQVGALRIVTTLETAPDLGTINLDAPAYTLELTFASGSQHKLEVGDLTPTGSGYYARYDGEKVYVISQSGIDSLLNLLTSPPYPATPTPSATLTPSVTDTPTLTLSAETLTPTP